MADDALLAAAKQGDLAAAKQAREQGASLTCADGERGYFPLFWACREGHAEVAEYLLAEGTEVDMGVASGPVAGTSALSTAAQNGHAGCAELLLGAGADILHETTSGGTRVSGRFV